MTCHTLTHNENVQIGNQAYSMEYTQDGSKPIVLIIETCMPKPCIGRGDLYYLQLGFTLVRIALCLNLPLWLVVAVVAISS